MDSVESKQPLGDKRVRVESDDALLPFLVIETGGQASEGYVLEFVVEVTEMKLQRPKFY